MIIHHPLVVVDPGAGVSSSAFTKPKEELLGKVTTYVKLLFIWMAVAQEWNRNLLKPTWLLRSYLIAAPPGRKLGSQKWKAEQNPEILLCTSAPVLV